MPTPPSQKRGNISPREIVDHTATPGNVPYYADDGTLMDSGSTPGGGGGGTVTHAGGALTADLPVFGAGSADIKVGTKSGNTDEVMTASGSFTPGNTLVTDADGNAIDSGSAPGAAGVPGSGGGGGLQLAAYTKPTLSQFTGIITTATAADTSSGITVTGSNNQESLYMRSAGLSSTWNIEIGFLAVIGPENFGEAGLSMRAGSSGAYIDFVVQHGGNPLTLLIQRLSSARVFDTNVFSKGVPEIFPNPGAIYLRVQDDGSNRTYFVSPDLLIWMPIFVEARANWATVDRGGFVSQGSTNYPPCSRIVHYKEY